MVNPTPIIVGVVLFVLGLIVFLIILSKKTARSVENQTPTTELKNNDVPPVSLVQEIEEIKQENEEENRRIKKEPFAILSFSYRDIGGNSTRRTVEIWEYDEDLYGGMITGRCRLRNAERSFRLTEIRDCIDTETGETINELKAFLFRKYEASAEAVIDRLLGEHYDLLRVFLFLGKADKRLMPRERAIMIEHLRAISGDIRLNDDMLKGLLKEVAIPSLLAFEGCCQRLSKKLNEKEYQNLISIAEQIINKKTASNSELAAFEYLKNKQLIKQ